jgi:hypothetical protein
MGVGLQLRRAYLGGVLSSSHCLARINGPLASLDRPVRDPLDGEREAQSNALIPAKNARNGRLLTSERRGKPSLTQAVIANVIAQPFDRR